MKLKKTPTNYRKIFKDRLIIITGVGRSGTTILGKILGSMKNTAYVFEPAIIKYCAYSQGVLGALFEDYFLPQIQGRVNENPNDWTYYKNHITDEELQYRRENNNRRADALEHIKKNNFKFIIKMPEFHQYYDAWQEDYKNLNIKWVNIIRSGFDVVNSAIERKWYTDEYCNNNMVDWLIENPVLTPEFIDEQSQNLWPKYNQETRAACVWRCLTEKPIEGFELSYENFCEEPNLFVDVLTEFCGLQKTKLTEQHINSVKKHKKIEKNLFELRNIYPMERTKFINCLCALGYTI